MGRLSPAAGANALGGPLVHLDVTGSTNDHARAIALAGAPAGTVVVAEEQTSGRGRQGRSWVAPRGRALTLSALVRAEAGTFGLLPLTVAVAVADACELSADVKCAVKWPNDVWIDERKVAGILIEARPQEGWGVVGIGLNVDTPEDELDDELRQTATSLRIAQGSPANTAQTLEALLERLAAWLDAEPEQLLSAYRQRDALHGRRIAWTASGERLEGEAQGIDGDGNLVVFTGDGQRHVLAAGEVHLVRV